jgi:hypothetical protein
MPDTPSGAPEALDRLLEQLHDAQELYLSEEHRRIGVTYALNAAIEFMKSFEEVGSDDLLAPLVSLTAALADLDNGIPTPLLTIVEQKAGRHPERTAQQAIRVYAAIAMDLLMKSGLPVKAAARRVAGRLDRLGVTTSFGRRVTPNTVKNWRDTISRQAGESPEADLYHKVRRQMVIREDIPAETARGEVLAALEDVIRFYYDRA